MAHLPQYALKCGIPTSSCRLPVTTRIGASHPESKGQKQDSKGIDNCLVYSDYLIYNDTIVTPKCAKLKPSTAAEKRGQGRYTWGQWRVRNEGQVVVIRPSPGLDMGK